MSNKLKGFTIIELLTVIAIIAILSGILFVFTKGGNARARGMTCMGNMQAIAISMRMYTLDEGGFPPFDPTINAGDPLAGGLGLWALYAFDTTLAAAGTENRMGYLKGKQYLHCPEDKTHNDSDVPMDYVSYMQQDANGLAAGVEEWKYQPDPPDIPVVGENPERARKLASRFPPDNTVVTWCELHPGAYDTPSGTRDLVLFLDGSVRMLKTPDYAAGENHRSNPPLEWGELRDYVLP